MGMSAKKSYIINIATSQQNMLKIWVALIIFKNGCIYAGHELFPLHSCYPTSTGFGSPWDLHSNMIITGFTTWRAKTRKQCHRMCNVTFMHVF